MFRLRHPWNTATIPLDGERLFEQGGISDALHHMKSSFERMGLTFSVEEHYEDYSGKPGLDHWLVVNGKKYILHENLEGYGWGEAAWKFADMLNDQFALQNIDERLYLINGGNDGSAVFLSGEQFEWIDSILTDPLWKPLKVEAWKKVFKI